MNRGDDTARLRAGVGGLLLAALLFSVFTGLLMLVGPLFMLQVYDRVLASRSEETLVALSGLVAALHFFFWLLEYARVRVVSRVGACISDAMNGPVFFSAIEGAASGKTGAAASPEDIDAIRALFSSPVILAAFDVPWTPLFFAAIFVFHPMLGWLALAGGGVLILAAVLNQILTQAGTERATHGMLAAARFARQAEAAGDYVVAQGMGAAMLKRWLSLRNRAVDRAMEASDRTAAFFAFIRAFRLLLQSAMLAAGAWCVLQGELTAGAMIAASILLGRALAPIEVGVSQWAVVQRARSGWRALIGLLNNTGPRPRQTVLPPPSARLDVTSVSLVLAPGQKPVLNHVTLQIGPGQALGVIGRSGSGKTSLARVVTGLVAPTSGEVRLAGATPDRYGPERTGRFIGYLPQDLHFFDGTIAENIARMAVEPDDQKVVTAAKKARLHDIVLSLPEGYDTWIDGAAPSLSGGRSSAWALRAPFTTIPSFWFWTNRTLHSMPKVPKPCTPP